MKCTISLYHYTDSSAVISEEILGQAWHNSWWMLLFGIEEPVELKPGKDTLKLNRMGSTGHRWNSGSNVRQTIHPLMEQLRHNSFLFRSQSSFAVLETHQTPFIRSSNLPPSDSFPIALPMSASSADLPQTESQKTAEITAAESPIPDSKTEKKESRTAAEKAAEKEQELPQKSPSSNGNLIDHRRNGGQITR